jgi:integrase
MCELIEMGKNNPHRQDMKGFIFWAEKLPDKPMEQDIFRRDLKDALAKIGLNKETVKNYTFHGWRHFFTAYMRPLLNEKILQLQTGHKTLEMLNHYAGHRIVGDKERLRQAQIETFSGLLPDNVGSLLRIGA